jgi:hypothetical protein
MTWLLIVIGAAFPLGLIGLMIYRIVKGSSEVG